MKPRVINAGHHYNVCEVMNEEAKASLVLYDHSCKWLVNQLWVHSLYFGEPTWLRRPTINMVMVTALLSHPSLMVTPTMASCGPFQQGKPTIFCKYSSFMDNPHVWLDKPICES